MMKEEGKMKKSNFLWKILIFASLLCFALSFAAIAHAADPCEGGVHKGPFYYVLIENATCTEDGSQDKYCSACQQKIGNEPIIHIGHQYILQTITIKDPTCTAEGQKQTKSVCRVCGYLDVSSVKNESIAALGHDWGDWRVEKAATCEVDGYEARYCNRCRLREERPLTKIGHKWDGGVVTRQPDCTNKGIKLFTCQNDPAHTKTEEIAIIPDAHNWDGGKVTKQPNCTEKGVKTYTCTINSSHTKTEEIPIVPDAHVWDNGKVTVPAECEKEGTKVYTCQLNSSHTKTETIPATGHKWDKGTVTKEPTLTENGNKHYVCENNSSHTKDEVIPKTTFSNNTICAFGPRLRDVNLFPYNTDVWYMFTPFDASQDGRQTFELVASNNYIVGSVTLTIRDGKLTLDYTLKGNTIDITLEFFTILNQISDIHVYTPEELRALNMKVRVPIDLQEKFGDDRNLVLYFCSRCDYTYSNAFLPLEYTSPAHQRLLNEMLNMMDK